MKYKSVNALDENGKKAGRRERKAMRKQVFIDNHALHSASAKAEAKRIKREKLAAAETKPA